MDLKVDISAIENDVRSRAVSTPTGERSFTTTFEDPIDGALDDLAHGLQAFMFAAGVENVYNLKPEKISTRLNKTQLSQYCHDLAHYVSRGMKALSEAGKDKRRHQSQMIEIQNDKIELQAKLIACEEKKTEEIQTVMKNEVKSWSEILTKNVTAPTPSRNLHVSVSPKQIERAVKKVVAEEDRSKNLIVYGVAESDDENVDDIVSGIMDTVGVKPRVVERRRIGLSKLDRPRPIRVTFTSGDIVEEILRKSGKLKQSSSFNRTYLDADRSVSERTEHRKLVEELKKKILSDRDHYHYIRQGKIVSVKRAESGA